MQTYRLPTATIYMEDNHVIDIELPSQLDTTRGVGIPIPEIVSLIASLAPSLISLLSGIKGSKRRKYEAIEEIVKSDKTDSEKIMLIEQILKI